MQVLQYDNLIPVIAIAAGVIVAVFWIAIATIAEILKTRSVEQTKREVAAYVAEGSMTPEDGERLINAGPSTEA